MGSLVPSSVVQFSQGAAKARTISHCDESSGALDTVVTKRWRYDDGGTSVDPRTTSGLSASTSGAAGSRATGFRSAKKKIEIESLDVLTRRATSRVTYRSLSEARSASSVIEHLIDAAAGKEISNVDYATGATEDCTIGLSVMLDAVEDFPSSSTSFENAMLSDQEDRLNLSTNLGNGSPWKATSLAVASGIGIPSSSLEARRNSLESLQKQLRNWTGGKAKRERGGKGPVQGAGIQLPDYIEAALSVNSNKDPAEYLLLYGKLLGAGRLQDCVAILESMNEHSMLNMDKVNSHEFYSACKKTRALKEAFRFSRLVRRKLLRNYSMLLSVCAQAQDASAACRVLEMVRNAGLKADCIFYTTLISACAKSGRVDLMFKFLNEMETEGIQANVQTFGAVIDGCARAGDVPKAFGIYKKMLNQNVKPDRVIFNTLITGCGRAGALLRAFEVLADMQDELNGVALDHFTYGTLIAACARVGEVERALEVYKRMRSSKIAGTAECYTAAVHACTQKGYLKSALSIYEDMKKDGVVPDEVFFCALINVAGHAGKLDTAFSILQEMKSEGINPGPSTFNTLMVACSNVGDAEGAMRAYEEIKALRLRPTVSILNALVASLCAGRELDCALTVLQEFRMTGVMPTNDTYCILLGACEREDQASIAHKLYEHSKGDLIQPSLEMFSNILDLWIRRVDCETIPPNHSCLLNIYSNDEHVVVRQHWANLGVAIYDDLLSASLIPTLGIISQVLGCLRICERHISNEETSSNPLKNSEKLTTIHIDNACGIYLPRALTIYEDATTSGVIQNVNYAAVPTSVDMRNVPIYAGEVGVLSLLKGLKHRYDEGMYLNSVKLLFAVEVKEVFTARGGFKRVHVSSRTGDAVMTLLRKLRIKYEGHESAGEVTIGSSVIRNWFRATQKARALSAVETNSLSCSALSMASVTPREQRLSHYSLRAIENAAVV